MATRKIKPTEEEEVEAFMKALKHPFLKEIQFLRQLIKATDERIKERIKWKAPSYYFIEDMLTFNLWAQQHVHLVFHHPAIVKIKSALLTGDYKDRRMVYFNSQEEIDKHQKELTGIIKKLVAEIEKIKR